MPVLFPYVPEQLGGAHKLGNIADKNPLQKCSWLAAASAMCRASSKSEALRAFRDWKQHWQHRRPNAVACVERDLDALLNFFAVPQEHWIKVRTTNVIYRAFR